MRAPTGAGWLTVALDGNFAAVGDPGNNQVHLFERSGTTWRFTQSLPRPGTGGTFFGKALAYDGGILAVGAETWTYLYARTAAGLVLMQSIRRDGNLFGTVTLSNNGKAFFLSDPFDDTRASAAGIVEAFDTPPAAAVQAWTARDVGVTGVAGSASLTDTTRSISGSGADIWNRADGLHFAATSLTGDGAIIARLSSLQTGNSWAKFGLMLREDFSAAAKNVMALVTPGGRIGVQARASTAELTTFRDAGTQALPVWLMLTRAGNTIAAFRSADGDNWIALGSVSMALPATVLVGYAITSHDNTRLITGQLDGLELVSMNEPPPPPPTATPPAAPANLNGALAGPQSVSLTWTDAATNENGFVVERSIASTGSYAAIVTLPANATSHVDSGLSASTAYTYRLRAFRDDSGGRLYSAYSNTFTIATQSGSQSSASGQDIGNVGVAGSSSASGGVITIRGGGADIWGAADAFHFYQQTVSGDFDLRARVRSLTATHAWAKAGVMVRESLDARARNVFALLTAGNAAGLQSRDVFGGGTSFTAGPWNRAPYWVRLVRTGNTFQGFTSPDGNNWTAVGTRTLALPAQLHAGIAVTSHDATRVTEAIVESFSLGGSTQPPPPPPPPPPPAGTWTDRVLGTGTGSVAIDDVDIDIVARGADIWGANDSGYFVYRTWRGDGEIVARIDSMSAGHAWSKAGLMMRASLAPNSANALVNVTPTNGATFQVRPLDGAATELVQHVRGPRAPAWLRLTRRGSIISAAHSIDGANWVSIGSRNLTAAEEIYVGFAVSSHDLAASTRAVFSAFQVR